MAIPSFGCRQSGWLGAPFSRNLGRTPGRNRTRWDRANRALGAITRSDELPFWSSIMLRRAATQAALAALLLAAPMTVAIVPIPVQARPAPDSFADLAAKLLPSVVNISTSQTLK